MQSVSRATLVRYLEQTEVFRTWAKAKGLRINSHDLLDSAMSQYLLELYEDGLHVWEGTYVVYGFQFLYNRGVDKQYLPLAKKGLKAWRKRQPSSMRLPVPEEVVWAVGNVLIDLEFLSCAAALCLQFVTYMRPSEVITLRHSQLCPPVSEAMRSYNTWGIVLAPQGLKQTTKTGEVDDSILVDCKNFPWLHDVLEHIHKPGSTAKLFPDLSLSAYERCFKKAVEKLQLPVHFTPHVVRHSGASNDFMHRRKSLKAIQKQGRWASFKSCRRYEKSALVLQSWTKFSAAQRKQIIALAKKFPSKVCNETARL